MVHVKMAENVIFVDFKLTLILESNLPPHSTRIAPEKKQKSFFDTTAHLYKRVSVHPLVCLLPFLDATASL